MAREGCDVLIVGGGPAGSSCARRLREAGFDVLVMDKQNFPRDKVCAGWITPAVVQTLRLDVDDYTRGGRVFQPIKGFLTGVERARQVGTAYDKPVSFGIRRCEFDHYLLERSGARLALGVPLGSLSRDGARWLVNGRIETPLIVGAGGHFCPVARYLGARPGRSELAVTAQEIEFEMDAEQREACRILPDVPELFFCDDMKGYAWCFRKGNFLNIGLGREGAHHLSSYTEAFRDLLIREGKISATTPTEFRGHAYLLYSSARRKVVDDGVLLIGDAAGLAYPQSGEGIRPAIESGLLAAETIIAAQGRYGKDRLLRYELGLARRYGPREVRPGPDRLLPAGARQRLAHWLLATRWFSRRVVLERWFLHLHHKPLVVSGAA
jgi:geranylgeranyl reductase family protein